MHTQAQSSYQKKLDQLRAAKLKIEHQLQEESSFDWNEDMIMWRQSLLDELIKIEDEIDQVKHAMSREQEHPTFIIEANGGTQRQVKVVPDNLVSPGSGMISPSSPLAKALLNPQAQVGETIQASTPRGTNSYRLIKKLTD